MFNDLKNKPEKSRAVTAATEPGKGKIRVFRGFDSRGFTFIETLIALFIVMVGISSFYALINQSLSYTRSSSFTLMASYLGKEGIEIVKNIRDSNFLNVHYTDTGSWTDGLLGCAGGCNADYTTRSLTPYDGSYLQVSGSDPNRFFS
jgi:hypothetical protein